MGVNEKTLRRDVVLETLDETVRTLQRDDLEVRLSTCDALQIGTEEWEACRDQLIEDLQEAEDWAAREQALSHLSGAAPPIDSDEGAEFLPSHATLALFQSAMDEQLDETPDRSLRPGDPRWLKVLYHRLRARVAGKAPFTVHQRPEDFRFDLPSQVTVALVSDWGMGNAHATAVARQIRACDPDHVIHLGDVYYAGTRREMQRYCLDIWKAHGPRRARYWALNGNHDMYSGGYGYFQHLLPAFGQPSSYFNLSNSNWRLVGLDSAYVNHNFTTPQMKWLGDQLSGDSRTLLLTHHHLFSAFRKRGDALEEWLQPFLADGRIFGWFWGHEHHLVQYADYRGMKCRCIGHGSVPYEPPDRRSPRYPVDVVRMESRPSSRDADSGLHGFALLRFDGTALHIDYIDEEGGTAWSEDWS